MQAAYAHAIEAYRFYSYGDACLLERKGEEIQEDEHWHRTGRRGAARLETPRGTIRTPAFMPVGTAATVKAMYPDQVRDLGADIVLGNTYHLMLRPGAEEVAALGGLQDFMQWDGLF